LAAAIIECIEADARCINLSLALAQPSSKDVRELEQVLDHATKRRAIIVAAAGNQGALDSTALTHYPWVIPVWQVGLRYETQQIFECYEWLMLGFTYVQPNLLDSYNVSSKRRQIMYL
jgi:hypothetical protein